MSIEFNWPIRVYYEDTDAGGIVYYANYLKFYERARTEWLNHLNINQVELLEHNIVFVVIKANVEYIKPAKFNDQCVVKSRIVKVSAASMEFEQAFYCEFKKDNELQSVLLNIASIKVACLKLKSFSPCRIPTTIKEEFQRVC